jgi:hypothetical protein
MAKKSFSDLANSFLESEIPNYLIAIVCFVAGCCAKAPPWACDFTLCLWSLILAYSSMSRK